MLIQEVFKSTGMKSEDIFYLLDTHKKGFLTLSSVLENLPIKFGINLTINQHIEFFNYLDRNKDGLVIFDDFNIFFDSQFSTMIFEKLNKNFNDIMDNMQESILLFFNKHNIDIKNIFDFLNNNKGYLNIDDLILFFRVFTNTNFNANDTKLIFELIFNDKNTRLLGMRKFIIFLEILGVNTSLFTDVS